MHRGPEWGGSTGAYNTRGAVGGAAAARREPRGGALNEAAKAAGCTVRGVVHSMWIGEEDAKGLDELIVVGGRWRGGADLTERKRKLLDDADVLVALPGGVGTLDERMPPRDPCPTRLARPPARTAALTHLHPPRPPDLPEQSSRRSRRRRQRGQLRRRRQRRRRGR